MITKVELYDIQKSHRIKDWNYPYLPQKGDSINVGSKTYVVGGIMYYESFIRIWSSEV